MRSGQRRRETLWLSGGLVVTTFSGASQPILLASLNAAALALRPFTVVRTRGYLFARSDQIAAAEAWDISYGQAVVSDQASAIGITAIPTPVVDSDSDLWFVYEQIAGTLQFSTAAGFREVGRDHRIDSKAMRKVEDGQDLVTVGETSSASLGVVLLDSFRQLIKLH